MSLITTNTYVPVNMNTFLKNSLYIHFMMHMKLFAKQKKKITTLYCGAKLLPSSLTKLSKTYRSFQRIDLIQIRGKVILVYNFSFNRHAKKFS